MPRKKTTKRAPKRHGASNLLSSVSAMEKDLLKAPAKLAATLHKEINTHQQKENKSAKILNKIKDKVKHAETRSKDAEAASTPLAKKQFKKWKKAYAIAIKMCDQAAKRHESISTTLETLLKKQAKYIAMQKHMNQFEKDWVRQSKNTSNIKSSKKSTKNKSTSSANQHDAHAEKMEVVVDNAGLNGPTELAS